VQLHALFAQAVEQLGGPERATPKGIQHLMQTPGLTLGHIKSHLQRWRLVVRAGGDTITLADGSSSPDLTLLETATSAAAAAAAAAAAGPSSSAAVLQEPPGGGGRAAGAGGSVNSSGASGIDNFQGQHTGSESTRAAARSAGGLQQQGPHDSSVMQIMAAAAAAAAAALATSAPQQQHGSPEAVPGVPLSDSSPSAVAFQLLSLIEAGKQLAAASTSPLKALPVDDERSATSPERQLQPTSTEAALAAALAAAPPALTAGPAATSTVKQQQQSASVGPQLAAAGLLIAPPSITPVQQQQASSQQVLPLPPQAGQSLESQLQHVLPLLQLLQGAGPSSSANSQALPLAAAAADVLPAALQQLPALMWRDLEVALSVQSELERKLADCLQVRNALSHVSFAMQPC